MSSCSSLASSVVTNASSDDSAVASAPSAQEYFVLERECANKLIRLEQEASNVRADMMFYRQRGKQLLVEELMRSHILTVPLEKQ